MSTRGGTGLQVRTYDIDDFEFRSSDEGDGFTFEGVASVVDKPYSVRDSQGEFHETIRAGAFNKTLADGGDVALLVNHNHQGIPMATRAAGTLDLTADPDLRVRASLDPARPDVQILKSAVDRGEMRQMSIGFRVPKARDSWNDTMDEREISELALVETSVVWKGANALTSAAMRSQLGTGLVTAELDDIIAELQSRGYEVDLEEPVDHSPEIARMMSSLHARRPSFL